MKFVTEFRDAQLAKSLLADIKKLADGNRTYRIMEVCGGHTHTIYRYGLKDLLPEQIEMIHGPGCPVCVLPMSRMDQAIQMVENHEIILTCFGDLMRVPGTKGNLFEVKAKGADIRMVYSPLDALRIAKENPDREVVFFAIGFETTAPSTAITILQAKAQGISNFSVYCNHITIVPPLRALLEDKDNYIDAFIGPGHVSTVVGSDPYSFIPQEFGKPVVVSGFEPLDMLQSIWMIVKQLKEGRAEVENQYTRAVRKEGNLKALEAMDKVFKPRDSFEWRGLGSILDSGLQLVDELEEFDAEKRFRDPKIKSVENPDLACGRVLKGRLKPWNCPSFGKECTPEHPLGALMVSSEGACAACYQYGGTQVGGK